MQLGRHGEALRSWQRAVDISPDDPLPHRNLALVHAKLGDMDAAWKEYRILQGIDPASAEEVLPLLSGSL